MGQTVSRLEMSQGCEAKEGTADPNLSFDACNQMDMVGAPGGKVRDLFPQACLAGDAAFCQLNFGR